MNRTYRTLEYTQVKKTRPDSD